MNSTATKQYGKASRPGTAPMVSGDLDFIRITHIPESRQQFVEFWCGENPCQLQLGPKGLESFSAFRRECLAVGILVRCLTVEERTGAAAALAWMDLLQEAMREGVGR